MLLQTTIWENIVAISIVFSFGFIVITCFRAEHSQPYTSAVTQWEDLLKNDQQTLLKKINTATANEIDKLAESIDFLDRHYLGKVEPWKISKTISDLYDKLYDRINTIHTL
jgi:hypothetical protein